MSTTSYPGHCQRCENWLIKIAQAEELFEITVRLNRRRIHWKRGAFAIKSSSEYDPLPRIEAVSGTCYECGYPQKINNPFASVPKGESWSINGKLWDDKYKPTTEAAWRRLFDDALNRTAKIIEAQKSRRVGSEISNLRLEDTDDA